MLAEFAETYLAAGDLTRAREAAEESLAIMRKLAAADPGNAEWQRDLSVSLDRVGDVRLAAGDRAGALAAYEESLAIMRKLAAADPGNARLAARPEREPRQGRRRAAGRGRPAGALAAYEESLAIMRKLAAADPGNAEWQRDLSVSLDKVGNVQLDRGRPRRGARRLRGEPRDLAQARRRRSGQCRLAARREREPRSRSATCGSPPATGPGRSPPTRRASRSRASSPPPIRAMPGGSAT